MRPHPLDIIPAGRALRQLCSVALAICAVSACSTLRGGENHDGDILGDTPDEVNWSDPRNAELEAENERLRLENEGLARRLAALEGAAGQATPSTAAAKEQAAPDSTQPQVKPQTVVSAVDVDEAFKGSPAPPVDPAPRLVQPSFASQEETVFENEAAGEIKTSSVLYGVHLASYSKTEDAQKGWRKLQRENPDQLGLLEPRVVEAKVEGRGTFVRLIGGGFSSEDKAAQLCASLKTRGVYCRVTSFEGQRLSIAEQG